MVPPVHRLIVGLTNPGGGGTPHNLGGDFVRQLARREGVALTFNAQLNALFGERIVEDKKIHLLIPQGGMNSSGESVFAYVNSYNFIPKRIVVVADEMAFGPGRWEIVDTCGFTRHNGVLSIAQKVSCEFSQLKVGIGRMPGLKLIEPMDPKVREKVPEDSIIEAMKALLISDTATVAGRFKQLNQG